MEQDVDVSLKKILMCQIPRMHAVHFICLGLNNCASYETRPYPSPIPFLFHQTASFVTAWRRHLLPLYY